MVITMTLNQVTGRREERAEMRSQGRISEHDEEHHTWTTAPGDAATNEVAYMEKTA